MTAAEVVRYRWFTSRRRAMYLPVRRAMAAQSMAKGRLFAATGNQDIYALRRPVNYRPAQR